MICSLEQYPQATQTEVMARGLLPVMFSSPVSCLIYTILSNKDRTGQNFFFKYLYIYFSIIKHELNRVLNMFYLFI